MHSLLNQQASRRDAGFSLVEILISLGIFAIGMTAIVSLFPAAAILQRETNQEVFSEMAAQSAKGIIEAQPLSYEWTGTAANGDLRNYHGSAVSKNSEAVPLYNIATTLISQRYTPADRSYPTGLANGAGIADCDLHWVPFIQDINGDPANPNWVVRLFLVEKNSGVVYTQGNANDANPTDPTNFPKVRRAALATSGGVSNNAATETYIFTLNTPLNPTDSLEPGDIIMDSNGNDHVVLDVNNAGNQISVLNSIAVTPNAPNKIWYAPKFTGNSSPARRVVTVEIDVVAP